MSNFSASVAPEDLLPDPRPSQPQGWLLGSAALIPVNLAPSLLLAVVGTVQSYGRYWEQIRRDPLLGLAGLLSAAAVATALLGEDWRLSLPGMFNYWPFLLMLPAFGAALADPESRRRLAQVLVLGSGLMLLLGWGEVLWGWQGHLFLGPLWITGVAGGERPAAAFTSPNLLAIYLVIHLCLAAGLWGVTRSRLTRAGLVAMLGLGSLLLLLTASRSGWGAGGLALLIGLVLRRCWWGIALLAGLGLASLAAALDWPGWRAVVPSLIWSRLADTWDPQAPHFSSTANRLDAWRFALQMVRERPLTGWGWQSFPALYNAQDPPELLGHCHNLYLHLAAEGGIPLLLGYLALWGWILARGWRAWRCSQEGLLLGMVLALTAFFAAGIVDVVILDGRLHLLMTLLLGAVWGSSLDPLHSEQNGVPADPFPSQAFQPMPQ
jgi:O-antigen ligase